MKYKISNKSGNHQSYLCGPGGCQEQARFVDKESSAQLCRSKKLSISADHLYQIARDDFSSSSNNSPMILEAS